MRARSPRVPLRCPSDRVPRAAEVTLRVWDNPDAKTAKTVEVKLVKGQHVFTSPSDMASALKLGKFASLRA